jgi:hypothetical protein
VLQLLHGRKDGGFGQLQSLFLNFWSTGVAVGDLDADGYADLVGSQGIWWAPEYTRVAVFLNRSPTWSTLGHALPSSDGVPLLAGAGEPIPDQLVSVTASLVTPPALGLLFTGFGTGFTAFQGGVLVPTPEVVVPMRPNLALEQRWPQGIPPGTPVYLQAWFQSLATGEVSASNALVTLAQ